MGKVEVMKNIYFFVISQQDHCVYTLWSGHQIFHIHKLETVAETTISIHKQNLLCQFLGDLVEFVLFQHAHLQQRNEEES